MYFISLLREHMTRASISVKVHSITMDRCRLSNAQPIELWVSSGDEARLTGTLFRFSNRNRVNRSWSFGYEPIDGGELYFHLSKLQLLSAQTPLAVGKLSLSEFASGSETTRDIVLSHLDDPHFISVRVTIRLCFDKQTDSTIPKHRHHEKRSHHKHDNNTNAHKSTTSKSLY